jgi:hypothetical protein
MRRSGSQRSHVGMYQFLSPSSYIAEGTRMLRTMVASIRTDALSPKSLRELDSTGAKSSRRFTINLDFSLAVDRCVERKHHPDRRSSVHANLLSIEFQDQI